MQRDYLHLPGAVPLDQALRAERAKARRLQSLTAAELIALNIAPREMLLAPWLARKSLSMAHSWRGTGKTWFALGVAYAVASGGRFLNWTAPTPHRVIYLDGEMPAVMLKERIANIIKGADQAWPDADYLRFIVGDLTEHGIPDLARKDGQAAIAEHLEGVDLVVIDNLSTLFRGIRENEGDDWQPVQDWLLRLRRAEKSVLVVHHSGKGSTQRGTSKKEDVLDSVLALRRPGDYSADQGARFEVHFEKSRGLCGLDARPFEAMLDLRDGAARWATKTLDESLDERMIKLDGDGYTQREIADAVGVSVGKVNKVLQRSRVHNGGVLNA